MKSQILGSSYVARSVNAADNRMVNLFPEATPEGGKEAGFLSRCPGLKKILTIGTGPIRGLWQFGGYAYAVSGTEVYKIDGAWTATLIGSVAEGGQVSMSDNGTQLFIATNPNGYIYNSTTLAFGPITSPNYPGAVNVGYLDGYFVFNQPNSQQIWITSLLDGTTIDATDFASAEGSPDFLVSLAIDHREAWLFGTNSIEVWYDSGDANFPLARIQGAFIEIGCPAPYSVAKLDNSLFWLGADARGNGIIYRAQGYTGVRVSTHAVEFAIQSYKTISDAIGYSYQQEGHAFYVLIFPTEGKTWVYDVSVQAWHERLGWKNGNWTRHRSNCQMNFGNKIVVGDYENGNLYEFNLDVYADGDYVQRYLRSWRALPSGQNNLKRSVQHSLQVDIEAGTGLDGIQQGTDPQISLRWSDDGGHKWGNYHDKSIGKIGETGQRVIWRRLGMTEKLRDRVYEISGSDPTKIAIMGAELDVVPTNA